LDEFFPAVTKLAEVVSDIFEPGMKWLQQVAPKTPRIFGIRGMWETVEGKLTDLRIEDARFRVPVESSLEIPQDEWAVG
jgi:hypothetical protein